MINMKVVSQVNSVNVKRKKERKGGRKMMIQKNEYIKVAAHRGSRETSGLACDIESSDDSVYIALNLP